MIKKIIFLALSILIHWNINAQDLFHKVPKDAQIIWTLNGEAFYKHVSSEELNNLLKKTEFFKTLSAKGFTFSNNELENMGIDIHSKAYVHALITDSVQFYGGIFPLKDKAQFENFLPDNKKITQVNGLNTFYSGKNDVRFSWDNHNLYVLTGIPMYAYFQRPDIKEKYGLLTSQNDYTDTIMDEEEIVLEDLDTSSWALEADSIYEEEYIDTLYEETLIDTAYMEEAVEDAIDEITEDEIGYIDSVLDQEEYEDDYYLEYRRIENHNDSIKNNLVQAWVNERLNQIVQGALLDKNVKAPKKLKDNELMRVDVRNLESFTSLYNQAFNYIPGFYPKINYGYEELISSLFLEESELKLHSEVKMKKEVAKKYHEIYKIKPNPKFKEFLHPDVLGFMSINFNTEKYFQHLPALVKSIYGFEDTDKIGNIVDLGSTLFDVLLDEKAIAKVIKGDNLLVLNGITRKEVTYTDYEYDDDFNATEVEKTRMETIPQFLWMFSSEDQRIFEKLIKLGINTGDVLEDAGIFEIKVKQNNAFTPYILMHKGIVFLGNDKLQLQNIQSNKAPQKLHKPFVDLMNKSQFSFLFNTKKLPSTINELGIPVQKSMENTFNELNNYGDFKMRGYSVSKDTYGFDVSLDFPKSKPNALLFLMNTFETLLNNAK